MLKQLHQDANRKPNSVFVDHFAGEVDARSGKPISHIRNGSLELDEADYDDGYGFYGSVGEDKPHDRTRKPGQRWAVTPGTKIKTVDL